MSQVGLYNTAFASVQISLPLVSTSTYQTNYFLLKATSTVAESTFQVEEFLDELEWDIISDKSHVRDGLSSLAAKALQEFFEGETEEGGFAVE